MMQRKTKTVIGAVVALWGVFSTNALAWGPSEPVENSMGNSQGWIEDPTGSLQIISGDVVPWTFSDPPADSSTPPVDNSPPPDWAQPWQPEGPSSDGSSESPPSSQPPGTSSGSPPRSQVGHGDIFLTADWRAIEFDHYPKEGEQVSFSLIVKNSNEYSGQVKVTFDLVVDSNENPDHAMIDQHHEWVVSVGAYSQTNIPVPFLVHRYMNRPYHFRLIGTATPISSQLGDSDPNNNRFNVQWMIPSVHLVQ